MSLNVSCFEQKCLLNYENVNVYSLEHNDDESAMTTSG